MGFRVAVVGATGNVGREMLATLAERNFPADDVIALASSASVGKEVSFGDDDTLQVRFTVPEQYADQVRTGKMETSCQVDTEGKQKGSHSQTQGRPGRYSKAVQRQPSASRVDQGDLENDRGHDEVGLGAHELDKREDPTDGLRR